MRWRLWLVAVAGCGFQPPAAALSVDAPVVAADWGAPTALFPGSGDDDPTLTGDLLEIVFNRADDIYHAVRASADVPFGQPSRVAELSTASVETTPEMSYDGLTIYLSSNRPGGKGNNDIWVSTRTSVAMPWSPPSHVDALSTTGNDTASAPSADGLAIVMNTNVTGNYDIYEATRAATSTAWPTPVALASVNTAGADDSPMLSADQLALYFDANRDGTDHLWMATRASTSEAFGSAAPITSANTLGAEADPWISPDSRHLFFAANGTLYEVSR